MARLFIEIIMVLYIILVMFLFYLYLNSVDLRLESKRFLTHFKLAYKRLIGKRRVATVRADIDLKGILGIMRNWDGGAIDSVIVINDDKTPIGIITSEDIRCEICKNPKHFPSTPAAKIMTKNLFTFRLKEIKNQAEFKERLQAAKLIGVNHLIVVDENNNLKDIFTTKDIFRTMEPGYGILSG